MSGAREFRYLLRARNGLFWIVTGEERRVERDVAEVAANDGYHVRFWDCARGASDINGSRIPLSVSFGGDSSPFAAFERIRARCGADGKPECAVWILRDLHDWLGDPVIARGLKSLARELQDETDVAKLTQIVIISPASEIPITLRTAVTMLDWPLPTREELSAILDDVVKQSNGVVEGERDKVIDAAAGLAAEDAANAFARSLAEHVQPRRRVLASVVTHEKKRIIDKERVLTWYEPDPRGLAAVGGLDRLKRWLEERREAFSAEARAYRLPAPKGVLLVGIPGGGKSLVAKSIPTAWGLPLLRLDLGAMKGSLVGQSEGNIRRALRIAEAVAPVVLWLDEIEKAMAGSSGGYGGDGGVAADQLGTVLTWLQEREQEVFVVATANDIAALPPELSRKGRFDEVFFVDLPTTPERAAILATAIAARGRDPHAYDLTSLAVDSAGFSGAEVAELVASGLFRSFSDGRRPLVDGDIRAAIARTVPISKSSAERIEKLRAWAKERAVPASDPEPEALTPINPTGGFGRVMKEALPA